ncbi:MAG: YchF-related putative GTPase, partial [Halobacteriota archaeon]
MKTVGLAGKPNAGKSTFYTASTMADVDVADYPFTTIDANRGVAHVRTTCPCQALDDRCGNCEDGRRYVAVELVDVAGLVPGAHEGRGLGNQFLDELRQADSVINVVDSSGATDEEGEACEPGEHDPRDDVEFLRTELEMWLHGVVEDNWEKIERRSRAPDFDFEEEVTRAFTGVGASEADVRRALREIDAPEFEDWDDADRRALARELRRTSKPIQVAANKADVAADELLQPLVDEGAVPTSAASELALRRATEQGVVDYHPGDPTFDVVGDVSDSQRRGLEDIREVMAEHGGTGVQDALDEAVYG